jgi:hypothetical protein
MVFDLFINARPKKEFFYCDALKSKWAFFDLRRPNLTNSDRLQNDF